MTQLDRIDIAKVYDEALRWTVKSRSDPHVTYVVEVGDYSGNGRCDCDDFKMRFEKLLATKVTPGEAIRKGLVKWPNPKRKYQTRPEHALMCAHIIEAREQACCQFIRAISEAQRRNAAPNPY